MQFIEYVGRGSAGSSRGGWDRPESAPDIGRVPWRVRHGAGTTQPRAVKTRPAGVRTSLRIERSKICTQTILSRDAILRVRHDCKMCSRRAARRKLPPSASATTYICNCRKGPNIGVALYLKRGRVAHQWLVSNPGKGGEQRFPLGRLRLWCFRILLDAKGFLNCLPRAGFGRKSDIPSPDQWPSSSISSCAGQVVRRNARTEAADPEKLSAWPRLSKRFRAEEFG